MMSNLNPAIVFIVIFCHSYFRGDGEKFNDPSLLDNLREHHVSDYIVYIVVYCACNIRLRLELRLR